MLIKFFGKELGKELKVQIYTIITNLTEFSLKRIFLRCAILLWIILLLFSIISSIKTINSKSMTVSIIIPAFNEDKTVSNVIKAVKSLNYIDEIIVVDDGSQDNTAQVAEKAGAKVIQHLKNRGKGSAIKTGFNNSTGDIIVFLDADIKNLTSKQVDNIIKPIINGEADLTKTKFKREAGRVTELTAKPLLKFFFPEIKFDQPLSGQFAVKRSFLNRIKLEDDYGVDVGIVLDADARGMKIKEVDIGKIDHMLSSLNDLNLVATEVVRTIVDRATEYGRVAMIDSLGKSIRMEILGLSLVFLGVFSTFFIRPIPIQLGLGISIFGVVIAVFYIIKILRMSFNMMRKPGARLQTLKSFFYMHSPIVISGIILIAMISTLVGAVHYEDGKISIEPTSRNLIIFTTHNANNQTISVRGPYTVDSGLDNETSILRMPQDAMNTLEFNYGDSIYINSVQYTLNQTLPGEDNVMRVPSNVMNSLGLNIGDVIMDSSVRSLFTNLYAERYLPMQNNSNLTIKEGIIINPGSNNASTVSVYLNNQPVTSTVGVFKNGTYNVYVNGLLYKSIYYDDQNPQGNYTLYYGQNIINIVINGQNQSNMAFASSSEGWFLNLTFHNESQ